MNIRLAILLPAIFFSGYGCSTGDLRAWDDALYQANTGQQVQYNDESHTDWVGKIKWTYGVNNNRGFDRLSNTGNDYCKVWIIYEDKDVRTIRLDPSESTTTLYSSVYNLSETIEFCCGGDNVFNTTRGYCK